MRPMRLVNPLVRSPEVPTPSEEGPPAARQRRVWTPEQRIVGVACAVVLGVAVWLRFWTPSALWLDEALTVNIARAPLHEIPSLLRHDGAPPLFYWMLHLWMKIFGEGNLAVRSLSGVIGVITLPAAWLAGYRVGSRWWRPVDDPDAGDADDRDRRGRTVAWTLTLLLATSPFAVYYDTEARMYALVMLLSTLGLLAAASLMRRPSPWNTLALAAVTSGLLYSHYWAMYLVAVTGVVALWGAWRGLYRRSCCFALVGLGLGALTFLPWVPTFVFQTHHTGTPWAVTADFTAIVDTFTQLAGGNSDAGRGLALTFAFLGLLAVAGSALDGRRVVVDLRTRPGVRGIALVSVGTLVLAIVAGKLAGSTFASRYTSVIAVYGLVVLAYGATALSDRRVRQGVVGLACALGLAASVPNAFIARTQAGQVAAAIVAKARPGDVIAYCPDQLGPGVSRLLGKQYRQVTYPRGDPPQIVNWVDYDRTIASASPSAFAETLLDEAGPHAIWYVWANNYLGFGSACQQIATALGAARPTQAVVAESAPATPFEIFEGESLYRYPAR